MTVDIWSDLQRDISSWATRNFGDNPAWQPQLGLIEEVGEFFAAITDTQTPIIPAITDALGDQAIYALNLCEKVGIHFAADIANDDLGNGPQHLLDRELIGALALGCRAILKNAQGIRGMTWLERRNQLVISISMWYRWAQYQVEVLSLEDLEDIVTSTWAQVSKRDWLKNPDDANLRV